MPCSCFGKKDKKAAAAPAAAADKYCREAEKEPLATHTRAPAPAEAPAQPAPATPPRPVTPTSADARLRPEDDPDKASRRRDVVASFYSDQCELIGFKATGSRPPSAVVGGNNTASPPPGSLPSSSSRGSALSRADLALKRREFFKDLAVNDLNSSRYGSSEPSWRLVDAGSLTTPRRSHHHHHHHHHTLPSQARFGGVVLRPVSSPTKATSGPDLRITNGDSDDSFDDHDHDHHHDGGESEPLLPTGDHHHHHQEAGVQQQQQQPLVGIQVSEESQPTPAAAPVTPPGTPATPPPTPPASVEPSAPEMAILDPHPPPPPPLHSDTLMELAATQLEGSVMTPQRQEGQLVVQQQQQYVQQVSVGSDDERVGEGSSILIKEAFPDDESPSHPHTNTSLHHHDDDPHTTTVWPTSTPTPTPSTQQVEAQDARHVSQHSSEQQQQQQQQQQHEEQPTTPPPTDTTTTTTTTTHRPPSILEEEEQVTEQLTLDTHFLPPLLQCDQDLTTPTSFTETPPPSSPQQSPPPPPGHDPQPDSEGSPDDHQRLTPTIVGCIPKAEDRSPSPPQTPPSPPASEDTNTPTPPTQPSIDERAPSSVPSPPTKSETCGVEVCSSTMEDDGLGSDIDDALSSLECLSEEGNTEKRATAST